MCVMYMYIHTVFIYVCTQYLYVCVCIDTHKHHVFLSQSSVEVHSDCFIVLVIVNCVAMKIGVHVYFLKNIFFIYLF